MFKCCIFLFVLSLIFSCTIRDKPVQAPTIAISPYDTAFQLIKEGELLVKEGDLILRNGQELSSQFIKNFNRTDKSYSHAGLLFFKNGYPFVYHIAPGEINSNEQLKADSLKHFCNPRKNSGFAIYRYNMTTREVQNLQTIVQQWERQGIAFDSTFNYTTNTRMYCSEMIKKGLAKATDNRINLSTTAPDKKEAAFFAQQLRLPLVYALTLQVVAIDNLFVSPHCKQIRRFNFNRQ